VVHEGDPKLFAVDTCRWRRPRRFIAVRPPEAFVAMRCPLRRVAKVVMRRGALVPESPAVEVIGDGAVVRRRGGEPSQRDDQPDDDDNRQKD
jgi:hypothetical protein